MAVGLQGRKGLGWRSRGTPGAVGTARAAAALGECWEARKEEEKELPEDS